MFDSNFKIIVYRGGTELFPENSIEAIQTSIKTDSQIIIEIDLQLTKDNNIIAFHDFHLDDLTNGKGKVNDFAFAELKTLFLRNPDRTISSTSKISTLEEIFTTFPNESFILDLHENNKVLFHKVIEIVERNKREKQIALVSIVDRVTDELRKLRPEWTFIASPNETKKFILANKLFLDKFVQTNSNIMFLPDKLGGMKILNTRAVKTLHRRNIKVWTCINFKPYQNVNSFKDLERLKELGVDGVYTDNPQKLLPLRVLDSFNLPRR
jgi:glycerophosphoryl diester phosphodiesterase